jgi:hypothetical protein
VRVRPGRVSRRSAASWTIRGGCGDCAPIPWIDQLVVWRDTAAQPVWAGPIVRIVEDPSAGELSVYAEDRTVWASKRAAGEQTVTVDADGNPTLVDPVDYLRVWLDEVDRLDPSGLTIVETSRGEPQQIEPFIRETAQLDVALQQMSDRAIDWTVVDRWMFAGAPLLDLPATSQLVASRDWRDGGPVVDVDGGQVADQVIVTGLGGVAGTWPRVFEPGQFGAHQLSISDSSVSTTIDAEGLARRIWESNRAPAVFVTGGGVSLTDAAPVCVPDLIPGQTVPLHADTSRYDVRSMMLLQSVTVEAETTAGGGLAETLVTLDLEPPGTEGTAR